MCPTPRQAGMLLISEVSCFVLGQGVGGQQQGIRSEKLSLMKARQAGEESGKKHWCCLQPRRQAWFISREEVAAHNSSMESPAVRGLILTVLYFFMGTTSNPILLIAKPRNFMLWRTIIMPLYMLTLHPCVVIFTAGADRGCLLVSARAGRPGRTSCSSSEQGSTEQVHGA